MEKDFQTKVKGEIEGEREAGEREGERGKQISTCLHTAVTEWHRLKCDYANSTIPMQYWV